MDEINLVESAYEELLKLPLSSMTRTRLQSALAALRDEIALLTDRDPEEVQDEFEYHAAQSQL